jgi:hypothetical protein
MKSRKTCSSDHLLVIKYEALKLAFLSFDVEGSDNSRSAAKKVELFAAAPRIVEKFMLCPLIFQLTRVPMVADTGRQRAPREAAPALSTGFPPWLR